MITAVPMPRTTTLGAAPPSFDAMATPASIGLYRLIALPATIESSSTIVASEATPGTRPAR
jgi:hypothetical protein